MELYTMNDRYKLNKELAQMLKGGVIMDVTTPEQARIAQEAGACAVMALERIPADIRAAGGVSRMSDPKMIKGIQEAVSIPVMAKCRIGHFAEAQILEAIEIDYIDESEVLSPADDVYHIDKTQFKVPFVCGARDLGEALRRIAEGASMIRTKGEPGTGDVVQAVRHMRAMNAEIRRVQGLRDDELFEAAVGKILEDYFEHYETTPDEPKDLAGHARRFFLYLADAPVFTEKLICSSNRFYFGEKVYRMQMSRYRAAGDPFGWLPPDEEALVLNHIRNTASDFYRKWVGDGKRVDKERAADLLASLTCAGVENLMR